MEIKVTCLLDRYWDPVKKIYSGTECSGTLIDVSIQSEEKHSGNLFPVGIILLDDNTFQSVPMEFIKKITV